MSLRRPPSAPEGHRRRPEDDEPLELAPDETIDGEVLTEEEEVASDAVVETEPRRARTNGNGRTATIERRAQVSEERPPAAVQPTAVALPAAVDSDELTLGQWLSRRWIYGL